MIISGRMDIRNKREIIFISRVKDFISSVL